MTNCPACRKALRGNELFCTGCSHRVGQKCWKCTSVVKLGAKFCTACGADQRAKVVPPTPGPGPVAAQRPSKIPPAVVRYGAIAAGVALLLSAAYFGYRSFDGAGSAQREEVSPVAVSGDQQLLRATQGPPASFTIVQSTIAGSPKRFESWNYASAARNFHFVDGKYAYAETTQARAAKSASTSIAPEALPPSASRSQVAKLMGEKAAFSIRIPAKVTKDGVLDVYAKGLIAGFAEDRLVSAEAISTQSSTALPGATNFAMAAADWLEQGGAGKLRVALRQLVVSDAFAQTTDPGKLSEMEWKAQEMLESVIVWTIGFAGKVTQYCVRKAQCASLASELKSTKEQLFAQIDKEISAGMNSEQHKTYLRLLKEAYAHIDEEFAKQVAAEREKNKGTLRGLVEEYGPGVPALLLAAEVPVPWLLAASAVIGGVSVIRSDPPLDQFIATFVPELKALDTSVQYSLATKLLQVAVERQCTGLSAGRACTARVARDLLALSSTNDTRLQRVLKRAWCATAVLDQSFVVAECTRTALKGTIWRWSEDTRPKPSPQTCAGEDGSPTMPAVTGVVDFYGGGVNENLVAKLESSGRESRHFIANAPLTNFSYDESDVRFTASKVTVVATVDRNDPSIWCGTISADGHQVAFWGKRVQ